MFLTSALKNEKSFYARQICIIDDSFDEMKLQRFYVTLLV